MVTGQAFVDENGNGIFDFGEQALAGVSVILFNISNPEQTITITSVTNDEGYYRFVNVQPADYILSFAIPSGYVPLGATNVKLQVGSEGMEATNLSVQVSPTNDGTIIFPEIEGVSIHLPLIVR